MKRRDPKLVRSVTRLFRTAPFDSMDDADLAPGTLDGADAAPPFTWRRARQNLVWIYIAGLIFMVFAIPGLSVGDPAPAELAGRIALIVGIAAGYVAAAWIADTPLWVRISYIVGFVALLSMTASYSGWQFLNFGVYVAILLATLIPWRYARFSIPLWGLLLIGIAVGVGSWVPASMGLVGIGVGMATGGGIEAGRVATRLSRVEERVSVLAVAAERERIGRDLHDILGHSLTAISIKSGLARRLVAADPEAACLQIAEVEEIAREALADVRATASGIREVRVATEIASARSVLMAAGIEARTPSAVETISPETAQLFGYVVREAVTNVVRHSEATTCTITVSADEVVILDDGEGARSHAGSGTGLEGLRQRVEAAGGTLQARRRSEGGFLVRVQLAAPAVVTPAAGERRTRDAAVMS